jgi:hypothetical protein
MLRSVAMVAASMLVAGAAGAQSGERLTDKDVKALIEAVDQGRDRFEDALEGKVKDSVLRGPAGEVNVGKFLDDFQENMKRAKDRFKADYAASTEVQAVLRQGTDVDGYFRGLPGGTRGVSEWDRLTVDLRRLAEVYGTVFPLPANAPVRRINDGEAAQTARTVAQQADAFRKAVNNDKALPAPVRDSLKADAEELAKRAKTLESRMKGNKPATSEARAVLEHAANIQNRFGSQLSPGTLQAWGVMRAPLSALEQAFGIVPPPPTPR